MNEQEIRKIAEDLKIDAIGFFTLEPLNECLPYLEKRIKKGFFTGFEGGEPQDRIDYQLFFPEGKTGIVVGINNYQMIKKPHDKIERGAIASVAWGNDYHNVLKDKLMELVAAINKIYREKNNKNLNYKIAVDNTPLVDRGSAYRAGLGFFGKNNCIINEKLGSYFFIGQLLLDCEISFKKIIPIESQCGECTKCIDACPNGALGEGASLNPSLCISYLTQKKELNKDEEKRLKIYLYGCDICQRVCPYNSNLIETREKKFLINSDTVFPQIDDILSMSNRIFKEKFGKTAAGWRGKKTIIRNATIIAKNNNDK